jgi:hypothetical protein
MEEVVTSGLSSEGVTSVSTVDGAVVSVVVMTGVEAATVDDSGGSNAAGGSLSWLSSFSTGCWGVSEVLGSKFVSIVVELPSEVAFSIVGMTFLVLGAVTELEEFVTKLEQGVTLGPNH